MRLAAATLIPIFFLGLLELGLRLAGYGYPTRLFLPAKIGGEDFLVPNEKFTHRFFPPGLARAPLSTAVMPVRKPAKSQRIFLMGESAAYGDPDSSFGVGRYLEVLLEQRYPDHDFEVICVAITAINSHVILPIARECARLDGDMWVVYMGNNEMVGPYGASTVFGNRAPALGFVRIALALKKTRLGQLMDQLVTSMRGGSQAPESWAGIDMFRKNPLQHDDPLRLRAYENFKANLADILNVANQAGVPVVLSTVASNLRDCSPFLSMHRTDLAAADLAEWQRNFDQGHALEKSGSPQAALDVYQKAAAIDSGFAELHFRIGTCQLALDDRAGASSSFERARDHDALAVRADRRINRIITDAMEKNAVSGLDAVTALASHTSDGIPGKEHFYEHVHLTMAGNYLLACALAGKVAERLPAGITATGSEGTFEAELEACNRGLAVTLWDQKRVWEIALGRISVAPFTSQSSHPQNRRYCQERIKEVDFKTTAMTPVRDRRMYETALEQNPGDTQMRWNYAQFLERAGKLAEAADQGVLICERLPHSAWTHYFTGSVMARQGEIAEAADYLQRAIRINPELSHARLELDEIRRKYPTALTSVK
ncbi:MAG: tetratricopeptide repeat protein [Akkermansiaceae bacterium]